MFKYMFFEEDLDLEGSIFFQELNYRTSLLIISAYAVCVILFIFFASS